MPYFASVKQITQTACELNRSAQQSECRKVKRSLTLTPDFDLCTFGPWPCPLKSNSIYLPDLWLSGHCTALSRRESRPPLGNGEEAGAVTHMSTDTQANYCPGLRLYLFIVSNTGLFSEKKKKVLSLMCWLVIFPKEVFFFWFSCIFFFLPKHILPRRHFPHLPSESEFNFHSHCELCESFCDGFTGSKPVSIMLTPLIASSFL